MADALFRQPVLSPPLEDDDVEEVQVAVITTRGESNDDNTITDLLPRSSVTSDISLSFADEQYNDELLQPIIVYLKDGKLPDNEKLAKKVVAEASLHTVVNDIFII